MFSILKGTGPPVKLFKLADTDRPVLPYLWNVSIGFWKSLGKFCFILCYWGQGGIHWPFLFARVLPRADW
jgi:hypothetical protein